MVAIPVKILFHTRHRKGKKLIKSKYFLHKVKVEVFIHPQLFVILWVIVQGVGYPNKIAGQSNYWSKYIQKFYGCFFWLRKLAISGFLKGDYMQRRIFI